MRELFEKEGQSIVTFKKGDLIYRTKPMIIKKQVLNENLGVSIEVDIQSDSTFRSFPIEFICIENNTIYLKWLNTDYKGNRRICRLILEDWFNDWALFVVPDGLKIEDCYDNL